MVDVTVLPVAVSARPPISVTSGLHNRWLSLQGPKSRQSRVRGVSQPEGSLAALGAAADPDQAVVDVTHDMKEEAAFPLGDWPKAGDSQRQPSSCHDVVL